MTTGHFRVIAPRDKYKVDELIQLVARRAGISPAAAALAVAALLDYLTARLPSPMVGRIREQLSEGDSLRQANASDGGQK